MKVYKKSSDLIGNTPLLELSSLKAEFNYNADIYAKLELFNPAGSAKDRIALSMIEDAENKGLLVKGSVIIEPTSGNTGIGIASVCSAKGYKAVIVMPDSMSAERISLMRAYGAQVVLTDGALGMQGAVEKAEQLKRSIPYAVILGQFDNYANPNAHYLTTGPEIFSDMDGKVDIFVSSVGTGGTLTGVGKYLKEQNPNIKIVAVEPENSPLLSKGVVGKHKIQGIGANFIPKTLDKSVIDEIITVSDEDAYAFALKVAKKEGILVGISSGAALSASIELAKRDENAGKKIVVIFPDSGERYLSTKGLFD